MKRIRSYFPWARQDRCCPSGLRRLAPVIALFLLSLSPHVAGASEDRISEAEFLGASLAGEEIAAWFRDLSARPKSVSIFSTSTKAPLAEDFGNVLDTEIYKNLSRIDQLRVQSCPDCRTPQVRVMGDRIVLIKGAPDIETLRQKGRENQVESFLVVETYRTSLALMVVANLYQTSSGEIVGSKTFRIPAVSLGPSAAIILFNGGVGIELGGKNSSAEGQAPPFSASVSFLEELGFGKGGISAGGVFTADNGALFYVVPTIGWRGHFGASAIYSLTTIGLGYGQAGKTGITPRATYDVMIGSFTNIGLEAEALIPIQGGEKDKTFSGFAGLHIGFVLGR